MYFGLRRGNSEDWDRLMLTLGLEEHIADPRFEGFGREATSIGRYAPEVKPIWEQAFQQLTNADVVKLVHEFHGDAVPFNNYPALCAHPQVAELDILKEVDHPAGAASGPSARYGVLRIHRQKLRPPHRLSVSIRTRFSPGLG